MKTNFLFFNQQNTSYKPLEELTQTFADNGIKLVVTRKSVKNVNFRLNKDTFSVSAPKYISEFELSKLIHSKLNWAVQHYNKSKLTSNRHLFLPEKQLINKANVNIWGKTYNIDLSFENTKQPSINIVDSKANVVLPYKYIDAEPNLNEFFIAFFRSQLTEITPSLFEKWQPIVGKTAQQVRFKKMNTRWGSCNVKDKRVWLSLYLAQFPIECTEYVIVHELCHLHEANHSKRFWSHVANSMPDYKTWHNHLKNKPL